MKRFAKIAILLCICVAALVGVAACSSVTEISIDKKNSSSLQTVFVQGEELDLSGGWLNVTTKDGTEHIKLDSEGITVTGYDSQTLGKQTLTIEYSGKTTTLTITVVQRMTAANFSSEYFVGDSFNKEKGVLQIYNNDGTYDTVNISDDRVSVSGFDSSKEGECEVTLTYKDDTVEYTGSITVTVYEVFSITIKKPNKITYKSHETELNLSGGYITIKNADESYSKTVSLTEDMVEGFDLSAATYENSRETDLIQTLTISYGGKTVSFNISISYSDVSLIQDCAELLDGLSWSGSSIPYISDEQGQLAIEALSLFDNLTADDKTYIDDDVYLAIARVASVYGISQLRAVLESNKAVIQYNNGEYEFISCGYEDAKADYANLSADDIIEIANQLIYAMNTYGDKYLFGNVTISSYLQMVPGYINSVELLDFLFSLYESSLYTVWYDEVSAGTGEYTYDSTSGKYTYVGSGKGNYNINEEGIPEDWSLDSSDSKYLINYYSTITSIYSSIVYGGFYNSSYRSAYSLLCDWRSDFFTFLYEYWAIYSENAVKNLSVVYLTYPFDEIDELTTLLYNECNNIYVSMYYASSGYEVSYDSSDFMYYYEEYLKYLDIAANSSDTVTKILYEVVTIDVAISEDDSVSKTLEKWYEFFTYDMPYGYNSRTYHYTGIDAIDELWSDYLEIVVLYYEAVTESGFTIQNFVSGETGTKIAVMFENFVALSPTEQYSFLSSVNVCYTYYYPELGLSFGINSDNEIEAYNLFTLFVANYYDTKLDDDEFELFSYLLMSLELYARQYEFGISYFITYMEKSVSLYKELSGISDDGGFVSGAHGVTVFNSYVGFLYTKCSAIYALYDSEGNYIGSTDLGEWQDSFDELATCLVEVYKAYANYAYSSSYYSVAVFAAFESADAIVQKILSGASESVINAFYYMPVQITIGSYTYSFSLDYTMSIMREYYGYYMSYNTIDGEAVKNSYKNSGLQTFVKDANYLFRISLKYDETTYGSYDSQTVLSLMSEFRSLTAAQRYLFIQIDTVNTKNYDDSLYYASLDDFFYGVLSAEAADVADKLMYAEYTYIFYDYDYDGLFIDGNKTADAFIMYMGYAIKTYNDLSSADKAAFDELLGDVYTMYLAVYNTLNTDANA